MSSPKQSNEAMTAETLAEIAREIEAIANRAAERVEAEFFAYARQLRQRAAAASNSDNTEMD